MNRTEVVQMARDYLDRGYRLSADLGFEMAEVSRSDFKEWEVECSIFSMASSKMVKYRVIIHDDEARCARQL